MDYQEATDLIVKDFLEEEVDGVALIKAEEVALIALDKQIPKKPDLEGDGYCDGELVYDTWICPNCGKHYEIEYDDYDYCPECGQRIDRSELDS